MLHLGHNVFAALPYLAAAACLAAGLLAGRARPPRKRLEAVYQEGRADTIGEACDRVERRGLVLRLSPEGTAAWCSAGSRQDVDGAYAALSLDDPRPAETVGRDVAGSALATMAESISGPGHYPDGRPYPVLPGIVNAELAALALPPGGAESESDGPAPSPYPNGRLTPAQRRRDRHKRRGAYAEGDMPGPPTDIGQWWADELAALLRDGQSEWFSERMTEAGADV